MIEPAAIWPPWLIATRIVPTTKQVPAERRTTAGVDARRSQIRRRSTGAIRSDATVVAERPETPRPFVRSDQRGVRAKRSSKIPRTVPKKKVCATNWTRGSVP